MSQKPFDNEERTRYYGIRVGDIVSPKGLSTVESSLGKCKVVRYGVLDNNRIHIQSIETGEETDWVAEWCEIITKVEDIENTSSQERITQIGYYRELVNHLIQINLYIEQGHNYSHKLANLKNTFSNFCISIGQKKEFTFDANNMLVYDIFHSIEMLSNIMREDYLDNYNRSILQSDLNKIYNRIHSL